MICLLFFSRLFIMNYQMTQKLLFIDLVALGVLGKKALRSWCSLVVKGELSSPLSVMWVVGLNSSAHPRYKMYWSHLQSKLSLLCRVYIQNPYSFSYQQHKNWQKDKGWMPWLPHWHIWVASLNHPHHVLLLAMSRWILNCRQFYHKAGTFVHYVIYQHKN